MLQATASGSRIGRRSYAVAAAGLVLFIAYGSLVPLTFHPMPLDQAMARFTRGLELSVHPDSNTDFATNTLLGIPLGYLTLAALGTDRRGVWRRLVSAVAALAFCVVVSCAVEFAQTFFPARTPSFSDIVAQAAGGTAGVLLWLAAGSSVTAWLRAFADEREQDALAHRILLGYCVLFIASQLVPLDLTLSLGELAQKYRNGRIVLQPFGYVHATFLEAAWDYAGDVVLQIPLGAAAALLWTRNGEPRRRVVALAIAVGVITAIELAQVFVSSRYADVTDVLTGALGAGLGVALVYRYVPVKHRGRLARDVSIGTRAARLGAGLWILALLTYHWNPFDFTTDPGRVARGMHQLLTAPFSSYYLGAPFNAFTQMLRKSLLALPLGVMFRAAWPPGRGPEASRLYIIPASLAGVIVLLVIEVGQVFLPSRTPDITDVVIGELGLILGYWLMGLLMRRPRQHVNR